MSQPAYKLYTLEEYFALEEAAQERHEYYQGYIYAMSGATPNHARIVLNVAGTLNSLLEGKPCEAFTSNLKVLARQINFASYPEVSVVCGKLEYAPRRKDTVTNPVLLVEVLSKSTRAYDRGVKFDRYMQISSFADYLLIEPDKIQVDYYHRLGPDTWLLHRYKDLSQNIELKSLDITLSLEQIYRRVEFEPETETEGEVTLEETEDNE